jgi:hypothetical protein
MGPGHLFEYCSREAKIMHNTAITNVVPGSMLDEANKTGQPLANSWMNCKVAVMCDGSASMHEMDSRDGHSRFDILAEELVKLQAAHPGQVAVISFSSYAEWSPSGNPVLFGANTNMRAALEYVQRLDDLGILFFMISDGEPDSEDETLALARIFKSHINTIYVGPESDNGGKSFLNKLAKATHGSHQDDFRVNQLAAKVEKLLLSSGQ